MKIRTNGELPYEATLQALAMRALHLVCPWAFEHECSQLSMLEHTQHAVETGTRDAVGRWT